MLSTPELLRRITERGGLEPSVAGRLTRVTLKALAGQLHATQAQDFADELPPTLSEWFLSADFDGARGLPQLVERVAVESFTGEHAAVVCQVLAEALGSSAVRELADALPRDVARLFVPSAR